MDATPHPRNSEATRGALLLAARRRFTLLGYARTTTRDVAADAGVNVALISRYFGSKDGLLAAVLDESVTQLDQAPDGDVVTGFVDGLAPDAYPEFGSEHPLRLLLRGSGEDESLARLRRQALQTAVARIQDQATGADGDPGGDPGSDPGTSRLRADLVLALFAGVVMLRDALPDEPVGTADLDLLRTELARVVTAVLG